MLHQYSYDNKSEQSRSYGMREQLWLEARARSYDTLQLKSCCNNTAITAACMSLMSRCKRNHARSRRNSPSMDCMVTFGELGVHGGRWACMEVVGRALGVLIGHQQRVMGRVASSCGEFHELGISFSLSLIGMGIAAVGNIHLPAGRFCNCYKAGSLTNTILDTTQISNLRDRYVLGGQLGWGQFGVIRVCSDKLTGDVFACKSIAKDRLVTPDDLCSIKLEIEIMTKLSGHPNVVDLKAVYEDEDSVHLIMELCAGGELFHMLEKHGRFSESDARDLFKHLMEVVKYCHDNGIVHRDLKPENILLSTKSSPSPIKLADFGLATYVKQGEESRILHGTVGSPFYIAPEVLTGGYNEAADVWSAGVILYILLSGMPPFGGKTKSKIFDAVRAAELRFPSDPWDHISLSARDLIIGMLCIDPSKRLSAAQVLDHPWVEGCRELAQEANKHNSHSDGSLLIKRNQDYSFSDESIASFNGKSSFYFIVESGSPCAAEMFSSPIPSMPSFTFFSSISAVEPQNAKTSKTSDEHGESNLVKLSILSDASDPMEQKTELRKGGRIPDSRHS
ncbi:Calcium-dependent protein kinase 33 [Hibiscus syriacus]|uniref:non-specific serine/threonine protein kinase n=1 Tax=Hibiscus syriacus TaxID=106335 RepID=A0A6A3C0L7_HIBSY|nr:Calcium-dependent protein kinase 33 [Hibiscus syriacus]